MKRMIIAATLIVAPTLAVAESQLERFERISEEMNEMIVELMAAGIENEGGDGTLVREAGVTMPKWDDAMRSAAGCVLERYNEESSVEAVDASFDAFETLIEDMEGKDFATAFEDDAMEKMLPEGITIDASGDISQECGMMDLQIRQMQESGLTAAMMEASMTIPNNE